MGDHRRFRLMAELVERNFSRTDLEIADVAAGKGKLKAALWEKGYRHVTSWDKRHKLAKPRPGCKYQLFDCRTAPKCYDLVVALHPDEATDHVILYATKHRVPFVVCPCCIKPSASRYTGQVSDKGAWVRHLVRLAQEGGLAVSETRLPMHGDNLVLIGRPKRGK